MEAYVQVWIHTAYKIEWWQVWLLSDKYVFFIVWNTKVFKPTLELMTFSIMVKVKSLGKGVIVWQIDRNQCLTYLSSKICAL